MTTMRSAARSVVIVGVLALSGLLASPGPAHAAGPWTTWLRAYNFSDLAVDSAAVWCATREGGLVRFDRATGAFTSITREPGGLASNRLSALALDRSQRLWTGTLGAGLSVLDAERVAWRLLNEFDGLPSDTVNVLETSGDTLWIGTPRGLTLWNGRQITGTLPDGVNPSPFRSNNVRGIATVGDSLFVGTSAGVHVSRLSGQLAEWDSVNAGLPSRVVEWLVTDGRDLFALSTDPTWTAGAGDPLGQPNPYRWNGAAWVRVTSVAGVRAIHADRGTIFLTAATGLYRWTGSAFTLIAGSPTSRTDRTFWLEPGVAPDGRLYGGMRDGVWEQPEGGGAWALRPLSQPPGNHVTNIAFNGSRLWVNTFNEGVGRFDGAQWKSWASGPCRPPSCSPDTAFLNSGFAFALVADRAGRTWVANWGALARPVTEPGAIERVDESTSPPTFDRISRWPDSTAIRPTIRHTFAVGATIDSQGGVWLGMDSPERETPASAPIGIDYYDANGVFVRNFGIGDGLKTGRILALDTDRTGRIWIGTTGGGVQYTDWPIVGGTPSFASTTGPDDIDVRGIVAAGDSIWTLGTDSVRVYSRSGGYRGKFAIPGGPVDNAGHPLEVALDGTVWAGTASGIRVFRPDGSVITDYTTANSPLATDQVRAIRVDPATGHVWIGTTAGLHRYDPGWQPPPPPVVDRLEARVYPNPARITALGVGLRIAGNVAAWRGGVYDLGGRLVHRFAGVRNGEILWDGRDLDGRALRPGVYFAHLQSGGRSAVVRVVLLY
jgi:ligand-binding sensor domain-containing protein